MREFLSELFSNRILIAAIVAWAAAQLIKTIIYLILYREWRFERLVGSGGMPSSHAATVCALSVSALLHYGVGSPVFALCVIQTAIVLHDARGVRLETGKQAVTITAIIDHLLKEGKIIELPEFELKELIGHTPFQVLIGSLMGIGIGLWLG